MGGRHVSGTGWRYLALLDGEAIGTCTTGRLHIHRPDHPRFYLGAWVLPAHRRRGAGTALYRAASEAARSAGKSGFQTWVSEDVADGVRFLLAHGFEVAGRDKVVALDLRGMDAPAPAPPEGIRLVTLAERPDLIPDVHAAAVEAFPSIPSTTPIQPGSLDEFIAAAVEREGIPKDGFVVAVDEATGETAGYASLKLAAANPSLAYHHMTAVRPAYRGRGVATAMKRATIAWALRAGIEELRTGNDERNAPMRAVNARLGYRPRADYLALRGPLAQMPLGRAREHPPPHRPGRRRGPGRLRPHPQRGGAREHGLARADRVAGGDLPRRWRPLPRARRGRDRRRHRHHRPDLDVRPGVRAVLAGDLGAPGRAPEGQGSALYAAASDVAREAGKTGFYTELSAVHEDGLRFLVHRGFIETERSRMVRLDLAGLARPIRGRLPGSAS